MEERSSLDRRSQPLVVVVTGAESTGKSVLTQQLGDHFGVPAIPEYARDYIASLNRKYQFEDVERIAFEQVRQLQEQLDLKPSMIFVDTWLIITKIWFEEVFRRIPDWLENAIVAGPAGLFLLCDTDLPWVADPVRENGGERRLILQQRYFDEINRFGFPARIVRGSGNERFLCAVRAVGSFLKLPRLPHT